MDPQPTPSATPIANPIANIVLLNPEIPNNTGSIGRTCVASGAALHLIHPLAFDIDEKACRRAGLDYWPRLNLTNHDSLDDYERTKPATTNTWYLSARAQKSIYDITPTPGDHFVFGKESVGLPKDLLDAHPDQCLSIPIAPDERSLNLSTACAIVIYSCISSFIQNGHLQTSETGRLLPRNAQ
ncbi:MAG: tRNA (cytidine(34)-2'-O)-methyltransferase [Phycisphaerales bacterium]